MKMIDQIEGELSEPISNPAGIAGKSKDSLKIQKEHNRWKKEVENRRCEDFSQMSYWQMVRSGGML